MRAAAERMSVRLRMSCMASARRRRGELRAEQPFAIELELRHRVADVVQRQVGGTPVETGAGRPALGQLLQGAHVQVAIVEEALQLRHQARQETAVLADAVA